MMIYYNKKVFPRNGERPMLFHLYAIMTTTSFSRNYIDSVSPIMDRERIIEFIILSLVLWLQNYYFIFIYQIKGKIFFRLSLQNSAVRVVLLTHRKFYLPIRQNVMPRRTNAAFISDTSWRVPFLSV